MSHCVRHCIEISAELLDALKLTVVLHFKFGTACSTGDSMRITPYLKVHLTVGGVKNAALTLGFALPRETQNEKRI